MATQFITNDKGEKTAVIVPITEYEDLLHQHHLSLELTDEYTKMIDAVIEQENDGKAQYVPFGKIKDRFLGRRFVYLLTASLLAILFIGTGFKNISNIGPIVPLPPLDQASLKQVMALDKQNKHATFVFVNEVPGRAKMHNRVIMLPPIGDELRINFDEYLHKGHDGPLYIILPDKYAGPKEKFILKAFPDYKGWYGSMLSDNFVMYAAK